MGKKYPRGPKGNFFLGSLGTIRKDFLGFLSDASAKYGDIFYFRLGPRKIYVVNNPELIHSVLVKQMRIVGRARFFTKLVGRLLGKGLVTSEGDFHRQQRSLIQPAFYHDRLVVYADVMAALTENHISTWQNRDELNLTDEMTQLSMAIISKTLFDADPANEGAQVGKAIRGLQGLAVEALTDLIVWPTWFPTKRNRKYHEYRKTIDTLVLKFIQDRRKTKTSVKDVLSILLVENDEAGLHGMSDRQIRDEVVTLFSAGYESTANAIVWAFYLLSQNPTVEEKLHRELDANLNGHKVVFSDLENLPYTEMVIKETLRLYPPSWSMGLRSPLSPIEIGGYMIYPGSLIWIVPYIMHRKSEYFTNPDEFIPERFEKESEKSLPRLAYLPFGGGHHICIGNAYATIEASIIFATIAKNYRLKVSRELVLEIKPEITLNIRNGLRVQLEARKTQNFSLQDHLPALVEFNRGPDDILHRPS